MKQICLSFTLLWACLLSPAWLLAQQHEPYDVHIQRDGISLHGSFYVSSDSASRPTVILLGGFPGNPNDVLGLGRRIAPEGIHVLTFQYSGSYQSEGVFCWDHAQKDVQAAFDFVRDSANIRKYGIDTSQIILGGYCFGGGMAWTYAARHPEVQRIFTIAGNDHGAFVRAYMHNAQARTAIDKMFDSWEQPEKPLRLAWEGKSPEYRQNYMLNDLSENPYYDLRNCAPELAQRDILLIGAWDDASVPMEHVILPLYRELQKAGAMHLRVRAFQDSHAFKNSSEKLAQLIIDWIHQ